MFLASEFELLSHIALLYRVHTDGIIRFSETDYKEKFPKDNNLMYLSKLERVGIVQRNRQIINVDTTRWAELFVNELERELYNLGYKYKCRYEKTELQIHIEDENEKIVKFHANFNEENFNKHTNTINFCYVRTFDYYLFWIYLINDSNTLEMFCAFVRGEITRFEYDKRERFNFFEGLGDDDVSELYHVHLRQYFIDRGYQVTDVSEILRETLTKLVRKDEYESYQVNIDKAELVVIKLGNKFEFLSFVDNKLLYPEYIKDFLNVLRQIVLKKVSQHRALMRFNKHKIIDNSRKTIQIASLLLAPFNLLMLYGISKGITWIQAFFDIKLLYFLIVAIVIASIVGTICLIVVPVVKLGRFDWSLK